MGSLMKLAEFCASYAKQLFAWLYGEFEKEELVKFLLLSGIFFVIIGTYWLLRPLKDAIFMNVVGEDYLPRAKFLSMFAILPLLFFYSKLVDWFARRQVFYILCSMYSVLAFLFAFFIYTTGVDPMLASPSRWWGWVWYVYVESFGTLMVSLFWAFAADITKPDSAARGYPIVVLGGQLGNILFSWAFVSFIGWCAVVDVDICGAQGPVYPGAIASVVLIAGFCIAGIMGLVKIFYRFISYAQLEGYSGRVEKELMQSSSFLEGLRLLFSSWYLLGIAFVVMSYEIIITLLDFNFKTFVKAAYANPNAQALYLGNFGFWVGVTSFLSIVFAINKIQRVLGLGVSLAVLPLMIILAVVGFKVHSYLGLLFWIMVLSKAMNYALTQPSIKQLYIPTSRQAKYKSQAFIDLYGSRGSKGIGSLINLMRKPLIEALGASAGLSVFISMCTGVSLGIIGVWFFVALYLGRTFKNAIERNEVVV